MALTREELLRTGGVSNQEALVKRLQDSIVVKPLKRVIPGGKTIYNDLNQKTMYQAVYNWLRHCRAFSEVTISWAKDPSQFRTSTKKIIDFESAGPREIWETHIEGRQFLARQMADVINKHQFVSMTAKKDGIYILVDEDKTFGPTKTVTQEDVDNFEKLKEELILEMEANTPEGEEVQLPQLTTPVVGQEVPSEAWEPYISFLPKRTKEYGK